jgi:putative oxygen-independent coproporphyrinogen III oxidase
MSDRDPAGLYVHVPFCITRCGYCDFNTYATLNHLKGRYSAALIDEADLWAKEWAGTPFVSLFLGGGTPTTLPIETLTGLLGALRHRFSFAPDPEFTVEANPDTVDRHYLGALRVAGANRLSIGGQSFDPVVLAALERIHGPESVRAALAAARQAGFADVNLDLIYGANGETIESWGRTLEEAVALRPEHLSCYALTIEPATSLGRQVSAGLLPGPDPDVQADMYFRACDVLGTAGYEHYEVSNWALPGHRSRHNTGYWDGCPSLGLGAGAHSYREGTRWWNVRPPARYLELVGRGERPIGASERLTDGERETERLLLGLRVADGVGEEEVDDGQARALVAAGLARQDSGRFLLTENGLFLENEVVAILSSGGES